MSYSEQENVEQSNDQSYSRLGYQLEADGYQESQELSWKIKLPRFHKFCILLLSLIASILSVSVPMLVGLANSVQSQNLYIGLMFTKGQLPFTDIFATGGFLYYVVIALAYWLGSTLWLLPVQLLAFYVSGIYLYKLINYFNKSQTVALAFSFIFYLLNITLGFGGLYPIQFAMPFVLVSLWFLTKYFAGIIKDEAFILYGFALAIAMLFEPRTLVFAGLSFLAVTLYNLKEKHIARGFYQLLCIILGTILVIYTAGYFILNLQVLSAYIDQAIVYSFTYFATSTANTYLSAISQLVFAFSAGLLLGGFSFLKDFKKVDNKFAKWLIFLTFVVYLVFATLSRSYDFYHLLPVIPFGLLLTSIVIGQRFQSSLKRTSHRRRRPQSSKSGVLNLFFGTHLYLPLLIFIVAFGQPIVTSRLPVKENNERSQVTSYLKKQVSSGESIYVWDSTANIYLGSQLVSSSKFPLPLVNTTQSSNKKALEDQLLQNSASYIIVNKNLTLSSTIKNDLSSQYKQVYVSGISSFTIYKKK